MLDKKKIIQEITKNKNFNIKVFQPFSDLIIEFLNDFSNTLKSQKEALSYPNLIYLIVWTSKRNIKELEKKFNVLKNKKKGLIQLMSLLPTSYPGHNILTEDIGEIIGEDNCKCGLKGKYFLVHGRIKEAEIRGCSDIG